MSTRRPLTTDVNAKAETILAQAWRSMVPRSARKTWPGSERLASGPIEFVFEPISCSEALRCKGMARAVLVDAGLKVDAYSLEDYEDECILQMLSRVCKQPPLNDGDTRPLRPLAVDAEDMRDHTRPEDRAVVFLWYRDFAAATAYDPAVETLTAEVIRDIAELVKKKDARTLSNRYASPELATYLLTTADPPSTSPTGK